MTRWFICTGLWLVLVQPVSSVETANLRVFDENERGLRVRSAPHTAPHAVRAQHHSSRHRRHAKLSRHRQMRTRKKRVREHVHRKPAHSSLVDHHGAIKAHAAHKHGVGKVHAAFGAPTEDVKKKIDELPVKAPVPVVHHAAVEKLTKHNPTVATDEETAALAAKATTTKKIAVAVQKEEKSALRAAHAESESKQDSLHVEAKTAPSLPNGYKFKSDALSGGSMTLKRAEAKTTTAGAGVTPMAQNTTAQNDTVDDAAIKDKIDQLPVQVPKPLIHPPEPIQNKSESEALKGFVMKDGVKAKIKTGPVSWNPPAGASVRRRSAH